MASRSKALLVAAAVAACFAATVPALAQTTANGPYYATPSWDLTLAPASRFVVLSNFASVAVLDRETGLVWDRYPPLDVDTSYNSLDACARAATGGRKGWRLPSVHELASLLDTGAGASGLMLPAGHPFGNVQPARYWTASVRVDVAPWVVNMGTGAIDFVSRDSGPYYRWCVRGGQNHARDY